MAALKRPGVFIFNCWVEAWGQHKWFPCEPNDTQAKQLVDESEHRVLRVVVNGVVREKSTDVPICSKLARASR